MPRIPLSFRISGKELSCTLFLRIIYNLLRISRLNNISVIHEYNLVGYVSGKCHLMGNYDHCGIILSQVPYNLEHLTGKLLAQGV